MSQDTITVRGIGGYGYHGVLEQERREGQQFFVDLDLDVDASPAAASDDLSQTVSYAQVAAEVAQIIEGEPVDLIETLATLISNQVLSHDAVTQVRVTVHKPQAPVGVPFDDVTVSITRSELSAVAAPAVASAAESDLPALEAPVVPAEATVGGSVADLPDQDQVQSEPAQEVSDPDPAGSQRSPSLPAAGGAAPIATAIAGAGAALAPPIAAAVPVTLAGSGTDASAEDGSQDRSDPAEPIESPTVVQEVESEGRPSLEESLNDPRGDSGHLAGESEISVADGNGAAMSSATVNPGSSHLDPSGAELPNVAVPNAVGTDAALAGAALAEAEEYVNDIDREIDLGGTPDEPVEVVLALGGNVGTVRETLRGAIEELINSDGLNITAVAPLARSAPVLAEGAPPQDDYLNTIVLAETTLSAFELLELVHSVESGFGRQRLTHWGERTLDIDIITYGDGVSHNGDLTLPHPRAHQRAFVLVPWAQLEPDAMIPGYPVPVAELARQAPDAEGIRWLNLNWFETTEASAPSAATGPLAEAGSRGDQPSSEHADDPFSEPAQASEAAELPEGGNTPVPAIPTLGAPVAPIEPPAFPGDLEQSADDADSRGIPHDLSSSDIDGDQQIPEVDPSIGSVPPADTGGFPWETSDAWGDDDASAAEALAADGQVQDVTADETADEVGGEAAESSTKDAHGRIWAPIERTPSITEGFNPDEDLDAADTHEGATPGIIEGAPGVVTEGATDGTSTQQPQFITESRRSQRLAEAQAAQDSSAEADTRVVGEAANEEFEASSPVNHTPVAVKRIEDVNSLQPASTALPWHTDGHNEPVENVTTDGEPPSPGSIADATAAEAAAAGGAGESQAPPNPVPAEAADVAELSAEPRQWDQPGPGSAPLKPRWAPLRQTDKE